MALRVRAGHFLGFRKSFEQIALEVIGIDSRDGLHRIAAAAADTPGVRLIIGGAAVKMGSGQDGVHKIPVLLPTGGQDLRIASRGEEPTRRRAQRGI